MNRTDAVQFLNDLLTDERDRFGHSMLHDDPAHEIPTYVVSPVSESIDLDAVAGRVFAVNEDGIYRLHEWATLKQITAVSEQHLHESLPVPTPADLPCPDWCDKPSGHAFTLYATTTRRDHTHRFSDRGVSVTLEQIERSPDPLTGITDLGIDQPQPRFGSSTDPAKSIT